MGKTMSQRAYGEPMKLGCIPKTLTLTFMALLSSSVILIFIIPASL